MRLRTRYASFVICGLTPAFAFAGQLPERFTLGRYVPGDVWFFFNGAHNDERAWLEKEWAEVFDALKASGIDRDITSLMLSFFGDENQADAEATIDKWIKLFQAVSWSDLAAKEVAFAEHFAVQPVGAGKAVLPEYFVLARGKAGSADGNMAGLVAILKELAALSEKINLVSRDLSGVTVRSLTFGGMEDHGLPYSLELFRKGDVIGLASGRGPLEKIVALMTGKSEKPAIVATRRFKAALSLVKSPEDFVMFFDGKSFISDMKRFMTFASRQGEPDQAQGVKILNTILKGIDICDVMDYTIVTVETEGRRELTHEVARLQPAKQKCALASYCLDRKPFKRFDQFIPVDATGFELTGFIELEGFYKLIFNFIKEDVPNGASLIEKWNGILTSIGFDPQRDLFSWLSGEMISISLPPAVVTPMGGGSDWVWMIRVKNGELAMQKVKALVGFISGIDHEIVRMLSVGQSFALTPVEGTNDGFYQLTIPALAMFLRPVIGVKGDWLMIGSSSSAINKCLDVSAGKAPSIAKNERFKREGLIPTGPVLSASFADTSKRGQEWGAAAGMVGMFGGMASGMIQGPHADKGKQVLQKITTAIAKLAPVLQKIDFYSSESSVTTYDGAMIVRTENVVTYKSPSSGDVKTAGTD